MRVMITFSYDGKRDVLKSVSMTFPKTGMTSIVGESGCGKSTVVNSKDQVIAGSVISKEAVAVVKPNFFCRDMAREL